VIQAASSLPTAVPVLNPQKPNLFFDVTGGVFVRVVFPGDGPKLHFLLCELQTENVSKIMNVCTSLFGLPSSQPPTLIQGRARRRMLA
jgi:hypothetical protein